MFKNFNLSLIKFFASAWDLPAFDGNLTGTMYTVHVCIVMHKICYNEIPLHERCHFLPLSSSLVNDLPLLLENSEMCVSYSSCHWSNCDES